MRARERILTRVRDALEERRKTPHPGPLRSGGPATHPGGAVEGFVDRFTASGGEVIRVADVEAARAWLHEFADAIDGVSVGATVPERLTPTRAPVPPADAELGISMAWGGVAETGSLVLLARDGRRTQLLPPTHVVVVAAGAVHATLSEALDALGSALPSAVALHSGPSKSADIGQVLVRGVHGPGRVVALVVDAGLST